MALIVTMNRLNPINDRPLFALKDLEGADNPRPRCPVALVLDTSLSMQGRPIEELREGVSTFFKEVLADECARYSVEAAVITFGGEVQTLMPFSTLADLSSGEAPRLEANGLTPLGGALGAALEALSGRKEAYQAAGIPCYQPWLVVLTDGKPNDKWQEAVDEVRRLAVAGKLVVMAVGVGPSADMEVLGRLCLPSQPPVRLRGLQFKALFRWLSRSIRQTTRHSIDHSPARLPYDNDFAFEIH